MSVLFDMFGRPFNVLSANEINTMKDNTALLGFKVATLGSLPLYNLSKMIIDEYNTGDTIDSVLSAGYSYIATNNYYRNYLDEIKFLSHFDGADNSTIVIDEVGNLGTCYGVATLKVAQKKFGTASLLVNGGGYAGFAHNNTFNIKDTGKFTIAGFCYWNVLSTTCQFMAHYADANNRWFFFYQNNKIYFQLKRTGGYNGGTVGWNFTPSMGQWYHFEISRNSNKDYTLYINGVSQGTQTDVGTGTWADLNAPLMIGGDPSGLTNCNSYFDDWVLSVGNQFHTSNFTPPAVPYFIPTPANFTIVSNIIDSEIVPKEGRIVFLYDSSEVINLNTDLKALIRREENSNWEEVDLIDEGFSDSTVKIISGNADLTAQNNGTALRYKIYSPTGKLINLYATSLLWK